jgi:hypothetical protein
MTINIREMMSKSLETIQQMASVQEAAKKNERKGC